MKRMIVALAVFFCIQTLCAQQWQADNSIFNPSGIPSLTFSQPRFADIDGDGDKDFFLGNTNNPPLFIENTGSVTAPDYIIGEDLTGGISALDAEMGVCADMDADGDLDMVTGGYTGLHLFLNTGSITAPMFSEVTGFFSALSVGNAPVPDMADVDNDGDLDLVVGLSESGSVRLYTNTGSSANGQFSEASVQVIGDVGLYAYPVFCDFDHDGDQDILVGRDAFGFIYYQNAGTSSAGNWQPNTTSFSGLGSTTYWNSPDLVDLNNDGRYDLVFGTASGPLQYYVNSGTDTNPVWQANTSLFGGVLDAGGASSPVFFDFDYDGDLDMISGSQMGNIKYYENTGNAHGPAWAEDNSYFTSIDHSIYAAVAIGDVNADSLPDAIIGDLSGHLYYHRNTGTGFVQETGVLASVALGGWSVPRLLDMDSDGDLDLVAGNEAGNIRYYENQGTTATPNWVEITGYFGGIDIGSNCVPTFADIDSDGDWDFLAGDGWGDLHCYLRQGTSWVVNAFIFSGITGDQNTAPALVDLDADGDLDLVLGDYDGTFRYFRNLTYSGTTLNPPLNLQAEVSDDVQLTWSAPATGSTSPFEQYNVYLNDDFVASTTGLNWNFTDLVGGEAYTAKVTAQYAAGESVPASTSWTMNVHNPPLNVTYELFSESIQLNWTAPEGSTVELDYYRVYVDSLLYAEPVEPACSILNPINGQTYHIQITAYYADGAESVPVILDIQFTGTEDNLQSPVALQNWPNPFKLTTTISFSVKQNDVASLDIFNVKGQRVRSWKALPAGKHSVMWDGRDEQGHSLGSGIYLYRLTSPKNTQMRKMFLK